MWLRRCHLCQRINAEALCAACWGQITPLPAAQQRLLLRPPPEPHLHLAYAAYQPPLKSILMDLKYQQARPLGRVLGRFLGQWYQAQRWPLPDLLIPVPLHPVRQQARRYNQAELIAQGLADVLNRPLCKALQRLKNTPPLHPLNPEQRQQVLQSCFKVSIAFQQPLQQQRILLVDDILTTGSTVLQAAMALSGASSKIISVSVARALIADPLISECI